MLPNTQGLDLIDFSKSSYCNFAFLSVFDSYFFPPSLSASQRLVSSGPFVLKSYNTQELIDLIISTPFDYNFDFIEFILRLQRLSWSLCVLGYYLI